MYGIVPVPDYAPRFHEYFMICFLFSFIQQLFRLIPRKAVHMSLCRAYMLDLLVPLHHIPYGTRATYLPAWTEHQLPRGTICSGLRLLESEPKKCLIFNPLRGRSGEKKKVHSQI